MTLLDSSPTVCHKKSDIQSPPQSPNKDLRSETPYWVSSVSISRSTYLRDHRVGGQVIYPAAGYGAAALALQRAMRGTRHDTKPIVLEDLEFHRVLPLADSQKVVLRLMYEPNRQEIIVTSRRSGASDTVTQRAIGRWVAPSTESESPRADYGQLFLRCREEVDVARFYQRLRRIGFEYGPLFQCIDRAWVNHSECEALAWLSVRPEIAASNDSWAKSITLLDGAFQTLSVAIAEATVNHYIPVRIRKLRILRELDRDAWCHAQVTRQPSRIFAGDITIFNSNNEPAIEVVGLRYVKLPARGDQ